MSFNPSQKLKGVQTLTPEEQIAADIMKALKEMKEVVLNQGFSMTKKLLLKKISYLNGDQKESEYSYEDDDENVDCVYIDEEEEKDDDDDDKSIDLEKTDDKETDDEFVHSEENIQDDDEETDDDNTNPTPPITTKAPLVKTILDLLLTIIQRVSVLEKDVQELKEADNTITLYNLLRSKILLAVNAYLGSSLGDALQKVLQKHMEELIQKILDFRLGYNKEMSRIKWRAIDKRRSELMVKLIDKKIQNWRALRRNIPLDRIEVLSDDGNPSRANIKQALREFRYTAKVETTTNTITFTLSTFDKPLALMTFHPSMDKALIDKKSRKKEILSSSKPKTSHIAKKSSSKKQVADTQRAEETMAIADATLSLYASELAEEQGNQFKLADTTKEVLSKTNEVVADNVIDELVDMANSQDANLNAFVTLSRTFFHKSSMTVKQSIKKSLPKFDKRVENTLKSQVPKIILKPLNREFNDLNKMESNRFVGLQKKMTKAIKTKVSIYVQHNARREIKVVHELVKYCVRKINKNAVDILELVNLNSDLVILIDPVSASPKAAT
nr:hypothetical protein [Tanacetum cinerariifolium]